MYAHVLGEVIDARRDEAKGEAWLQGRFTYMLYRCSGDAAQPMDEGERLVDLMPICH